MESRPIFPLPHVIFLPLCDVISLSPVCFGPQLPKINEGLTWGCLKLFLSFLFPFSVLFSSEAVSNTVDHRSPHSPLSLSLLHPACQLIFGALWFIGLVLLCSGTIRAQCGWMVFPEPYKASSSLLHWCVDATQLAAQQVWTAYCGGLTSRQMHMDAQGWKGLLYIFIVCIPLTLTTSLVGFLLLFSLSLSATITVTHATTRQCVEVTEASFGERIRKSDINYKVGKNDDRKQINVNMLD